MYPADVHFSHIKISRFQLSVRWMPELRNTKRRNFVSKHVARVIVLLALLLRTPKRALLPGRRARREARKGGRNTRRPAAARAFPNYTTFQNPAAAQAAAATDEPICFSGLQHSPDSPYSTRAGAARRAAGMRIGQQRTDIRVDLPIAARHTRPPLGSAWLGLVVAGALPCLLASASPACLSVCLADRCSATRGCVVRRISRIVTPR